MSVLHVIDGVVAGLARRHRQVELERAVVTSREEREARGVAPDLFQQLFHQHELAAALGHPHRLPLAEQRDELNDERLERLRGVAERLHRGAHARDVAVMVGAEQVDHVVDTGELHVVVERDVDGEVGQLAGAPPQHAVLVVAGALDGRRAEPERAVLLVREAAGGEVLHGLLRQAAVTYVALFRGPHVEVHAVGGERAALLLDHALDGPAAEVLEARALVAGHVARTARGAVFPGEVGQVFARIAVLRQGGALAELLAYARLERARERLELGAGVVHVELGRDRRALRAQQPRERIADGGGARVHDDERAGGVGGDELQARALAAVAGALPVGGAGGEDRVQRARRPRRRQEDVEESRAGHLDARDLGHRRKILRERVGDLARRPLGGARQRHRDVRRVVAVLGLARYFPRAVVGGRQPRRRQRRPHSFRQPLGDRH